MTIRPHPTGQHVDHRRLHAAEGAGQVDGDNPVPLLGGDLQQRVEGLDAGAGHEDLDRSELGPHPCECGGNRPSVGDVAFDGQGGRALGHEPGGRRPGALEVRVEQGDAMPVRPEHPPDTESDARCPAGDDGDAAHELPSAGVNSRCRLLKPRRIQVGS